MLRRTLLQHAALGGIALATGPLGRGETVFSLAERAEAAPLLQSAAETFTLVTNRVPSDLDPQSAYDAGSGLALQGPFEGLIRLKPGTTDEFEPVLAESWSANADGSEWTFQLRPGVHFHDGTPLDAGAARLSFERLFTLGLAPSTVLGRFINDPAQITTTGPYTLVFALGRPQPLFEAAIASPYGTAVVNAAALRQHEVDGDWGHAWAQLNTEGIGTGPYRLTSFEPADAVILERFADYWGGWEEEHFEKVIIRIVVEQETRRLLLETGDADLATTLRLAAIDELEANPDLRIDHRYTLMVRYLAMTVAGPLQAKEARQALCWAFPYQDVVAGVYEGFAKQAIGPVAELCRGFDPRTFRYTTDLDRARSLLRAAGVPEGSVLTVLLPPGNDDFSASVELFQANLAQIGVTLDIEQVDFATYVSIAMSDLPAEERPNLLPSFWQPDYNDGWNHLWPQVSCEAWQAGNIGHYCNQRVEDLLQQARDAVDDVANQAALSEIQQIVTRDDPAAIYMVQPESLIVLRRDIAGFVPQIVPSEQFDFSSLHRTADLGD